MLATLQAMMLTTWGWPLAECLHFLGMVLLFGSIAYLDLRLLGVARGLDVDTLRSLVPWGVAGFVLSAASGALFVLTTPGQYLHNPAFLLKLSFMLAAGLNMAMFHALLSRRAWRAGSGALPPAPARLCAAVSLLCWLGVIACGRVITAFRPPAYYWCPWC